MSKPRIPKIFKTIYAEAYKHSPEILTGIGITGMITATVLAVRATPKALILIEQKKDDLDVNELTPMMKTQAAWQCYIPATATFLVSTICIVGASKVNLKRNTALATAYSLTESALKEYQDKVVETIGGKKEQEVRDSIARDNISKNPVTNNEVIFTGKGKTLCYDTLSSRYFQFDIEKLRRVENDLNKRIINEMYVSLNDFYYEIGLRNTDNGDNMGWSIDTGFIDLVFSSQLAEDDTPCLVIEYRNLPRYDYQRLL